MLSRRRIRESQHLPPTQCPNSYPLALTGFLLELLGFSLRKVFNSTTYSQCVILVPTQTHLFRPYLLSTCHVPRILLSVAERRTGMVPAIMQLTFSSKEDREQNK